MEKQMKRNKGFSLIELLIAITILSIVMVMVGQFMSSSTAAYKKTKSNLNVQSEAMNVISNLSDTISQASYVRVAVNESVPYVITDVSGGKTSATRSRTVEASNVELTTDKKDQIDFDFVSDDYANHVRDITSNKQERKIIINFDTYQFKPEKTADGDYPHLGDMESSPQNVRSFRALRKGTDYYYVNPKYIYFEYEDILNPGQICCVIYRVDVSSGKIYLYRENYPETKTDRYSEMSTAVEALCSANSDTGLLTSSIKDFYLSADVEGNAILINAVFEKQGGYQYNSVETIKFRNSNALTVRPQKLYKEAGTGTGGTGGSGGTGGAGGTGGTDESGGTGGTGGSGGTGETET